MRRRPAELAAVAVVAVLVATGCAEQSTGDGAAASEGGVDVGASKAEYVEAFEGIDPISLNAQAPSPEGSPTGKQIEAYVAALEEWSGGKIEVELAFSSAVAPPIEVDNAFVDGRLDMGVTIPLYEPSEYPATNVLVAGAGLLANQGATVGVLESGTWPNQLAFENEAIMGELEDHGIVPLAPFFPLGPSAMMCSAEGRDLAAFDGRQIGVVSASQGTQAQSLGATPSSVVSTEVFEGLQRGVIDCAVLTSTGTVLS